MGARESDQPFSNCLGQVLWRRSRARTERHHAACEREQVLHAVIHLPEEKLLLFLSASALGNVPGDF